MRDESEYSEEDLALIRKVTSSSIHSVERKPFRPWRLLFAWWVVVAILGAISLIFARMEGAI